MDNSSDTQIQVAKITAKQAIIVALITTLGGLLGGLIIGGKDLLHMNISQKWIEIQHIEGDIGRYMRAIITINGVNYVYPSNVIWKEIATQMSIEKYPLPLTGDNYQILFSVYVISPGTTPADKLISQNVKINLSDIPTGKKICEVYPTDDIYQHATAKLKIHYSINK